MRRIIAVTGAEADKAIKEAERLGVELAAAAKLPDAELEKAVNAIKQVRGAGIKEGEKGGEKNHCTALDSRAGRVPLWFPLSCSCPCARRSRL